MEDRDVGILLNSNNIKLNRKYFEEMVRLLGINCIYRACREGTIYNGYGEFDTFFYEPILVGCIFDEHPTVKTMKKLGWNTELQEDLSIIHLPYDTPKISEGALVIVPSALDNTKGRVFRIIEMNTISIYPASIACKIGPVWESNFEESSLEHQDNDFTLLDTD